MSGKTGRRPTGKKPDTVRRRNAKTDGALARETARQVVSGFAARNTDKGARGNIERLMH